MEFLQENWIWLLLGLGAVWFLLGRGRMGCGMGGCYSCVVSMRSDDGGCHHVRSCLAGPVLPADRIVWE